MPRQFRVIDLIVIVAVFGVLLGLLVQATGTNDGRTCRITCANNIRQVGLALVQYHVTHNAFPMSAVGGNGPDRGMSGLVLALPYMDYQFEYNTYNFGQPNWSPANEDVVGTNLFSLICPDNPQQLTSTSAAQVQTIDGGTYPGTPRFAPCHYGVNWGGGQIGWASDFERANGRYRGVMMTIPSLGPKGANHLIGPNDIRDGMESTLLVAEKRDSFGWAVGGWGGSEFDPWTSPDYPGRDPLARRVYSGSFHDGGINAVFCDGSARFLRNTIDRKVWYGLLTRDGGERIDLEEE